MKTKTCRALLLLALIAWPIGAQACAVCGGADDVKVVHAANSVLWALLTLVGFIFAATGSAIYFLWKKTHASSEGTCSQYPPSQAAAD